MRKYLQYLWLRCVHHQRIIDYTGNLEGSKQYQYIRRECSEEYAEMCSTMPSLLKENGFDMIFRNIVISEFYYEKIFNILRYDVDSVMTKRVNESMKGSLIYLVIKVFSLWNKKLLRDGKIYTYSILRHIKWSKKRIDIDTVRNTIKEIDFDCVIVSNKAVKVFSEIQKKTYASFCENDLKPLFILFSNRYFVEKRDVGYILEIPLPPYLFRRYSIKERRLLNMASDWASRLDNLLKIRRKIISSIHNNFLQYLHLREIANEILGTGKAKCVLTFAENVLEYRTFLHIAKEYGIHTVLFHPTDGIHRLTYAAYYSDTVLVCNRQQYRNFIGIGYLPEKCKIVGSFNSTTVTNSANKSNRRCKILYFTKGTRSIDNAILDQLFEKLRSKNLNCKITVKKHPKDQNKYMLYERSGAFITEDLDYARFVDESDLIISQYSGVARSIIPLRKPIILYTYSDLLEFGERDFFRNVELPNYIKYVQNGHEFHQAIEQLLGLKEPEQLPEKLAEGLYGFMDSNCGDRIADIVRSFVNTEKL